MRLQVTTAALVLSFAVAALIACTGAGDRESRRAAAPTCADWFAAPGYRAQIAEVRPLVRRMQRAFGAPGLSLAVAAQGRIVWKHTCGFADLGRRRGVTPATPFRIGSVSKSITAVAAARLVQEGRLEVDADVRRYVPSFPRKAEPITVRQLGGHLAGIRHYRGAEPLSTTHYDSVGAALAVFADDPLVARPGERFSYSSYGFNLLGAALAGAARASFAEVVRQQVLEPLRMTRTRLDDGRASTRFYEVTEARRAIPAPHVDLSNRYPSGGFLSTATDLARLGLGATDARFLRAPAQQLLFSSQRTADGSPTEYGFGFEVGESPFGPVAGHIGNVVGGTAVLFVHPKTRVVVALATNVGFVTARTPPRIGRDVPDPPRLAAPFIRRVLSQRG